MTHTQVAQWQTWLKKHGYYYGEINGNYDGPTATALRKAQSEGHSTPQMEREVSGAPTAAHRTEDYQASQRSDQSVEVPKGPNLKEVSDSKKESNSWFDVISDAVKGAKEIITSKFSSEEPEEPEEIPAVRREGDKYYFNDHTPYDRSNLRDATLRYRFDNYYNDDNRKDQYGFFTKGDRLHIDHKIYTPEEAQAIAAGGGYKDYMYDGKIHKTNLFIGSPYKDEEDFKNTLNQWVKEGTITPEAAQYMISQEYDRQLHTYGTVTDMLNSKSDKQYNEYFGVVPFGYDPESMWSIAKGVPAVKNFDRPTELIDTNMITTDPTYRDEEGQEGRFRYNNYDEWHKGRVLADKNYINQNKGMNPTRAVTSSYSLGFPVASSMVDKTIRIAGGRPDYNEDGSFKGLDFASYHTLTDSEKGYMNPKIGLEFLSKDPQKVKAYLDYVVDNIEELGGDEERANAYLTEADRLAEAAGISRHGGAKKNKNYYHRYNFADNNTFFHKDAIFRKGDDVDIPLKYRVALGEIPEGHDVYSSLKSFRDNAFDEDGNYKQSFKYGESGYDYLDNTNKTFDGGNFTAEMHYNPKTGKWDWNAWDDWNVDLGGHDFGMNTNNGHGIRLRSDSAGTTYQDLYKSNTDAATRVKNEQLLKKKQASLNGQYTLKSGGRLLKYINNKYK